MHTKNKIIPEDAKYLARRVRGRYILKLYLWQDTYYEVSYDYGTDYIHRIDQLNSISDLDLYIESMHRIGVPEPSERDRAEKFNETGQRIAGMLKTDHLGFYHKLLWEEHLHWYCDMLEVRAAYLVDEIKTGKMKVTEARDIAIRQLLIGDPEQHIEPPYIKTDSDGYISFPWWFMGRKSQQGWLIDDEKPYGEGIRDVLCRLYEFGGWEDAPAKEYWDEQARKIEELKKKYGKE